MLHFSHKKINLYINTNVNIELINNKRDRCSLREIDVPRLGPNEVLAEIRSIFIQRQDNFI